MPEPEARLAGPSTETSQQDLDAVRRLKAAHQVMRQELARAIVGQTKVLDELLIALFCRGHCLLIGVPGLAKTLIIRTLAQVLSLKFARIQFTPDLMPADITGTEIIAEDRHTGERSFRFLHGPIFANIILADEINRTPPKTQAALLEAMQEYQVTAGGTKYSLDQPFFVLATQNPIEQEGTYPLPEAQLDRFMFNILVDYPEETEEFDIVRLTTGAQQVELKPVLSREDILELQEIVRRVPAADHVIRYAMALARKTRVTKPDAPDFIKQWVSWGAGPRASQYLILGAKARAVLHGRYYVSCEDIQAVAYPVLRHRIITNFNAEAEGVTTDQIIARLIETTPRSESEALTDARIPKVLRSQDAQPAGQS
jgi:MoxR-like ATPase